MTGPEPLDRLLLAHAGAAAAALGQVEDLAARLTALCDAAATAWPQLALDREVFVRHLGERLRDNDDPVAALGRARVEELYLACCCARGDERAIAEFERHYLGEVAGAVARMGNGPAFVDEVKQVLREKLFVADGEVAPKIADYGGRGPLSAWVRVAAVRTALSLRRQGAWQHAAEDERLLDLPSPVPDPELQYMKSQYLGSFKSAFQDAFAALTSRERNLLRLHFLDALSIDEIGAVYGVHRSTAARWIQRARELLFERTRDLLRTRLQVNTGEFDSVMRLVHSQLDLSIHEFLRKTRS